MLRHRHYSQLCHIFQSIGYTAYTHIEAIYLLHKIVSITSYILTLFYTSFFGIYPHREEGGGL